MNTKKMKKSVYLLVIFLIGCNQQYEYSNNALNTVTTIEKNSQNITLSNIQSYLDENTYLSLEVCDFFRFQRSKEFKKPIKGEFEKTSDYEKRVSEERLKPKYSKKWGDRIIRESYSTGGGYSKAENEKNITYNADTGEVSIDLKQVGYMRSKVGWSTNDYVAERDLGYCDSGYGDQILGVDIQTEEFQVPIPWAAIGIGGFQLTKEMPPEQVKLLKYEEIYPGSRTYNEFKIYLGFEDIANIFETTYKTSTSIYQRQQTGLNYQYTSAIDIDAKLAYFFVYSTKLDSLIYTYMSPNYSTSGLVNDINFAKFLKNSPPIVKEDHKEEELILMYVKNWDDGFRTKYPGDGEFYN